MDIFKKNINLIEQVIKISKEAGESILEIYNNPDIEFELKDDFSPLTKADLTSHQIIVKKLKEITPTIPILSEEKSNIPFSIRSKWRIYWLIDPLDGTKEFLKRNGEFTVNISLINNKRPIFGVIYIPINNHLFWGAKDLGSFEVQGDMEPKKINISEDIKQPIRIITSRSHPSEELNRWLKRINNHRLIKKGSSLKFCSVANGEADLYPRLGPTCEWDIAAGDAILTFAGGQVITQDKKKILYNLKENFLNPNFFALGNQSLIEDFLDLS